MAANTSPAGDDKAQALHARIEALNEEHEVLLATAVKQDEDIASAHRALQVFSPESCHTNDKPLDAVQAHIKCTRDSRTYRLTHTRIGCTPSQREPCVTYTAWFQERSEQAVELAQEVAGATAELQAAIAREQRQAAQLEQERRGWADHQQQSAAEAEAAGAQIAQLQGLLKDAHRQLGAAKVGGSPFIASV